MNTGVLPTANTDPLAGLYETVAEQLSVAEMPVKLTTRLHWLPCTNAMAVSFGKVSCGLTVSKTVTRALAVAALPLASVAVRTTVLAPTLEQLNVVLLKVNTGVPQLSVVPLFTAATVKVAVPALPK